MRIDSDGKTVRFGGEDYAQDPEIYPVGQSTRFSFKFVGKCTGETFTIDGWGSQLADFARHMLDSIEAHNDTSGP